VTSFGLKDSMIYYFLHLVSDERLKGNLSYILSGVYSMGFDVSN